MTDRCYEIYWIHSAPPEDARFPFWKQHSSWLLMTLGLSPQGKLYIFTLLAILIRECNEHLSLLGLLVASGFKLTLNFSLAYSCYLFPIYYNSSKDDLLMLTYINTLALCDIICYTATLTQFKKKKKQLRQLLFMFPNPSVSMCYVT